MKKKKKNHLFLCLCLFVDYQPKKKKKNKEFEHSKLEFHITRNSSLESLSIIEENKRALFTKSCMELEFTKLEFHVAFFQYKNPRQHKFFL